jgi:THO complex subunit 2
MHVYNAVLVLKEIIDVFPMAAVNDVVGSLIDLEMQRLTQSEERGDLKILARAYVIYMLVDWRRMNVAPI